MNEVIQPNRLHLGGGLLERLPDPVRAEFIKPVWLNLGTGEEWNPELPLKRKLDLGGLPFNRKAAAVARRLKRQVFAKSFEAAWRADVERKKEQCRNARKQTFYYESAERLTFEDNSLTFIFSEHFFEHLFMDEAFSLFMECYRVLVPGGVMRTIVPDADLRTYAPIEPAGINQMNVRPYSSVPWTHPGKHKTRWNVYSLCLLLKLVGFEPVPVVYCDKHGHYHQEWANGNLEAYGDIVDREAVTNRSYIRRPDSLVVDAVKKAIETETV